MVEHDGFVPDFDSTGKLARVRVRRGTRFAAGDVIASVNPFNHVHLNVGWAGEEINPLDLRLIHFEDGIRPTIAAGGIRLYDEAWQPIPRQRRKPAVVAGRVRIVVDGWDQADGNRPNRRLGLYALGYQILKADGTPVAGFERPRETIEFDRLALQPDAVSLHRDQHVQGRRGGRGVLGHVGPGSRRLRRAHSRPRRAGERGDRQPRFESRGRTAG
jgi:hypothetical protein